MSMVELQRVQLVAVPTMVTCPSHSSPLKIHIGEEYDGNGSVSPSSSVSPCSWKDSFEELSRNLQKICHSPKCDETDIKNIHYQEISSLSSSPACSPGHDSSIPCLIRQASVGESISCPYVGELKSMADRVVIRVRHEQSAELLQRQLSRISGLQEQKDRRSLDACTMDTLKTKDFSIMNGVGAAALVDKFKHHLRLNVPLQDQALGEVVVYCIDDQVVISIIHSKNKEIVLAQTVRPSDCSPDKLLCTVQDDELQVRQLGRKVVNIDSLWPSLEHSQENYHRRYYCPIFREDVEQQSWLLIWHVPHCFHSRNITVKTMDDRLVILCRHMSVITLLQSPTVDTTPSAYIKLSIALPETVDTATVSASLLPEVNQLLVYGYSGARVRSQTL